MIATPTGGNRGRAAALPAPDTPPTRGRTGFVTARHPWSPNAAGRQECRRRYTAATPGRGRVTLVTSRSVAARRVLPGSPFPAPAPVLPASEHVKVNDLVTHDRLGVGTVCRILDDINVLVQFRGGLPAKTVPHVKLTVL